MEKGLVLLYRCGRESSIPTMSCSGMRNHEECASANAGSAGVAVEDSRRRVARQQDPLNDRQASREIMLLHQASLKTQKQPAEVTANTTAKSGTKAFPTPVERNSVAVERTSLPHRLAYAATSASGSPHGCTLQFCFPNVCRNIKKMCTSGGE